MNAEDRSRLAEVSGYLFAKVEQFIGACSASTAIPEAELARRVGALLCSKEGGTLLGSLDHLSGMPQESARRSARLQQVAVAKRAYHRARDNQEPVVYEGWTAKPVSDNGKRQPIDGAEVYRLRAEGVPWFQIVETFGAKKTALQKAMDRYRQAAAQLEAIRKQENGNGTRLSAEGYRKLSEGMKARWAARRAQGKTGKLQANEGKIWMPAVTRIQNGRKVQVKGYWVKDSTGRSYNGNHWMQKVANRARKNAHVKRMRSGMNKMLKEAKP
jgi:hypothetical protein